MSVYFQRSICSESYRGYQILVETCTRKMTAIPDHTDHDSGLGAQGPQALSDDTYHPVLLIYSICPGTKAGYAPRVISTSRFRGSENNDE